MYSLVACSVKTCIIVEILTIRRLADLFSGPYILMSDLLVLLNMNLRISHVAVQEGSSKL
jgi:hypothetical protein